MVLGMFAVFVQVCLCHKCMYVSYVKHSATEPGALGTESDTQSSGSEPCPTLLDLFLWPLTSINFCTLRYYNLLKQKIKY